MIYVDDVRKTYHNRKEEIEALKSISFEVKKGTILGVLGPNGAGKSTLVKILATVIKSDGGSCCIDGCSIEDKNEYRKKFSAILQNSSLELWLTVEENLKIYGKFVGIKDEELYIKIDEVISLFGLEKYIKMRAGELSGGYRRRLQLAKIFMVDTPVIILDEPTVGLDPIYKNKIIKLLKEKAKQGKAIVFTTQVISEAEELCTDLLIINKGEKVEYTKANEIKKRFNMVSQLEIAVNQLNQEDIQLVEKLCVENQITYVIDKEEEKILLNLLMDNIRDREILSNIISELDVVGVNTKDPSLEEIFIKIIEGDDK